MICWPRRTSSTPPKEQAGCRERTPTCCSTTSKGGTSMSSATSRRTVPVPVSEWVEQWEHADAPRRDESDRYAIYFIDRRGPLTFHPEQRRLCETSLDGVGRAILTMLDEGE